MHLLDNQVKETLLLSLFFCPNKYLIYFKPQHEALEKNYQNTLWFAFLNIRVQMYALFWMQEFECHTREDPQADLLGSIGLEMLSLCVGPVVCWENISVPQLAFFHLPILWIKC